jgi:hypothetical protein
LKKYIFENGLGFTSPLDKNLDSMNKRVQGSKASLVIVDGLVGEGKTTLAVHCGMYLNKINGFEKFDLHNQLAMGGKEFTRKIKECYKLKYPVIIYDEAGDFNRRGSLTMFNSMLNRVFETYRAFKIIVICALPCFAVLDSQLFSNGIPRMLLHCQGRNDNYGNFRGYSLICMQWILYNRKGKALPNQSYNSTSPNFYGHFYDLEPAISRELDKISTKGKLEFLSSAEIKLDGLVSYVEITRKLNRSLAWVKNTMTKLKIKPDRHIKNRSYFKIEVIDILAGEVKR